MLPLLSQRLSHALQRSAARRLFIVLRSQWEQAQETRNGRPASSKQAARVVGLVNRSVDCCSKVFLRYVRGKVRGNEKDSARPESVRFIVFLGNDLSRAGLEPATHWLKARNNHFIRV